VMLVLVFHLDTLRNSADTVGFFNSEVDYTNSLRLLEKISGLVGVLGRDVLAGTVIVLLAIGIKRLTGRPSAIMTSLLVLYTVAVFTYFISKIFRTECVASCDATVIFLIDVAFVGPPLPAFFAFTETQNLKAVRATSLPLGLYLA